ncbi:response regulator transcription factor [Flavobacterium luteum]|uniref:Response regulator transcription factor n=2 Tax=Flavobacterium luteum TaxID=2026654 RepID=A0A7J5AH54_9FLAO|nr:response regulator transcription factor [Flavobacterium luteum]
MSYLLKNTDKKELTEAIKSVIEGNRYLPKKISDILLNDSIGIQNSNYFIPKLTVREKEILNLIIQEFTTEEIAVKLFVSTKTVESHRSNLIQKLGVKNSAGLVRVAFEKGLI